ncbi:sensor histidine kinase [Streptomyces rimosus]|uniref:sensor histidine kinase n=1 Tax=Streptomyces rimosus TaxID=1927 RepID=UPI000AA680D5|nr:histidine kinase [Streptomyces rimosus]
MRDDLPTRLAMASTLAVVVGFCVIDAAFVISGQPPAWRLVLAAAFLAGNLALQLCHSFPRLLRLPQRSRHWTLALQALLAFAPIPLFGDALMGMPPLLGASVLLVLPAVAGIPLCAAVAGVTLGVTFLLGEGWDAVYGCVEFVLNTLVVFGLSRLTDLVAEVHRSRAELTRLAVTGERLRFARDLHDLLGYSLSTITLKCELANRLIPRDTGRAQQELVEVLHTSRQALADVRTVARGYRQMSLADEADSARTMLATTGVQTTIDIDGSAPLSAEADTVLATVLREGLTNMLRHSKAERCVITTTHTPHSVRLRLTNDGATEPSATAAGNDSGSGIGNLTTRVTGLGGTLTATHQGQWFHLTAEVPLDPAPGRRGESDTDGYAPPGPRPTLAPRTANALTVAALVMYLLQGVVYMAVAPLTPAQLPVATVLLACGIALQARQTFPRMLPRLPLRHRHWTLALQAVLAFVPYAWYGQNWMGVPGLVAGTALLVLPRAAAWTVFAAVTVGNEILLVHLGITQFTIVFYTGFMTAMTGLVVFGLSRLTDLVAEVHRSRAELTRLAVTGERLRFARDLHDLLGYSLSTITLKCELANRLIPRDTGRAQQELVEVLHTSRQALADVRTVARGYRQMSLADEADSARTMLATTGVDTTIDIDATAPLSPEADTVLATVLREGLTNMLRHSRAERCIITTTHTPHSIRLRLTNDGATQPPVTAAAADDSGSGIGNLTTRVTGLGGTLTATHQDQWFHLTAEVPLDRTPATADA